MKFFSILAFLFVLFSGVTTSASEPNITKEMFESILNSDIVSVNVLLAEGADVNSIDNSGNTPLMLAIKIGNPRMIKLILAHNPDVNRKNKNGQTALMIANDNGLQEIADRLIKFGAGRAVHTTPFDEA